VPRETAEFPLPADVTDDERTTARREIGKYAKIIGEQPRAIRFEARTIGQTGPVQHLQYTRIYALDKGFLVAAHDLHEGIKVAYADEPDRLSHSFDNETVREFIDDELRFRKIIGPEPEAAASRPGHK
jgi:hypothetical protein